MLRLFDLSFSAGGPPVVGCGVDIFSELRRGSEFKKDQKPRIGRKNAAEVLRA